MMQYSTSIRIGTASQRVDRPFPNPRLKQLTGCLLVFAAAAFYYLSTVVIRRADHHVSIAPAFFVFVRFFMGFAIVCGSMLVKRRKLKPKRYDLLIGRAVANGAAVYCFYTAVARTTLAQANILNMTYPIFVALLSWIFLKKQRDMTTTIGAVAAFVGIYLILGQQGPMKFGGMHLWGLASGVSASFAMIFLNLSRQYHDTETILFFLFGIGSILTYAGFSHTIHLPSSIEIYFLVLSSGFAIIGQYCITFGYRYVTAVEGGIISSSRILLAATLGPYIAADPGLGIRGWLGAGLIFLVNVALAWRKSVHPPAKSDNSVDPALRQLACAHLKARIKFTRHRRHRLSKKSHMRRLN
jgi:drug/metabolite transporter (DMT)-like permease